MKKCSLAKVLAASLAAVSMFVAAGCNPEAPFTATEDTGIQVSKIELNTNVINLSGKRLITTASLTATATPSFAQDTTIYWTTSDESVVSLSAATGSSVTVIMQGAGTATVTAKSALGNVSTTCSVNCSLETTPPVDVTESSVTTVANGNNVFFTWTDPADYDEDLDYILIDSGAGQTAKIPAGIEYGWVRGLTAGTEYNFTLKSVDLNGNKSSGITVTATTEASVDEDAPYDVLDEVILENGGETISFGWDPTTCESVYQKVVITADDDGFLPETAVDGSGDSIYVVQENDSAILYIKDNTTDEIAVTGFEAGKEYTVSIYELNRDFVESDVKTVSVSAAPSVSGITASVKYTGSIIVNWTDFNDEYSYVVTATDGGSSTVTSDTISAGKETVHITGLTPGSTYTVTVSTYEGNTKLAESAGITISPVTVIWQIVNAYNTSYLMAPYITDSNSYMNVCTVSAASSWKYPYWIVRPSLYTPEDTDTFSLESSSTASISGASGLYLCIDNVQSYGSDASGWSYPSSSHPYHAYSLDTDTITSHMGSLDYASFKLLSSSVSQTDGFSPWYVWQVGSTGRYLYDTYLNVSGETSYSASSGDYVFAYTETIVE